MPAAVGPIAIRTPGSRSSAASTRSRFGWKEPGTHTQRVAVLASTGHSAFLYRNGWWAGAFVIGAVATTAVQLLENVWVAERQAIWFLGASTEWPGVETVDIEIGDVDALAAKYPDAADDLRAYQQVRGD